MRQNPARNINFVTPQTHFGPRQLLLQDRREFPAFVWNARSQTDEIVQESWAPALSLFPAGNTHVQPEMLLTQLSFGTSFL